MFILYVQSVTLYNSLGFCSVTLLYDSGINKIVLFSSTVSVGTKYFKSLSL